MSRTVYGITRRVLGFGLKFYNEKAHPISSRFPPSRCFFTRSTFTKMVTLVHLEAFCFIYFKAVCQYCLFELRDQHRVKIIGNYRNKIGTFPDAILLQGMKNY